jgi:hypothetical protein
MQGRRTATPNERRSMRYVDMIEDETGDLVDIAIYCSASCFTADTGRDSYGHGWPCPEQADYEQHCPTCGVVTVAAIGSESFDGWPA